MSGSQVYNKDGKEVLAPPRPPRSALMHFVDAIRRSGQGRNMANDAFLVACTDAWHRSLPFDQQAFMRIESDDRIRYENELRAYELQESLATGKADRKKKRSIKDPNRPKRPLTAFFVFTNEERKNVQERHPGISLTETSKVLGKIWRELDDNAKAGYAEKAKADKERYAREMAVYQTNQLANTPGPSHASPSPYGGTQFQEIPSSKKKTKMTVVVQHAAPSNGSASTLSEHPGQYSPLSKIPAMAQPQPQPSPLANATQISHHDSPSKPHLPHDDLLATNNIKTTDEPNSPPTFGDDWMDQFLN